MRTLLLAALLVTTACSGEKKPDKIRFVVDVDVKLAKDLSITIGGKPLTLSEPVPNVRTVYGFLDFAVAEIKPDAVPDVRMRTACGERLLAAAEMERAPPNQDNVVTIKIVERVMPKPAFVAAIDPAARNVKIGSFAVPADHPEFLTFYGDCAFAVSVDGQTAQMPAPTSADHSLLVAATTTACLTEGVVVYATRGAQCERDWVEKRTGQLAYWGRIHPSFAFRSIPASEGTYTKNNCIVRGFFGRC